MQEITLPPFAPTLMESTRALGYSLESAVADLIDNCITAGASEVSVRFWPFDGAYISILDNGCGMSPDELTNAMRYGSSNPLDTRSDKDLGRFGLGLKTASLSQCRCLTVISLKEGVLSGRRWDLDVVRARGEWILLGLGEDDMRAVPDLDKLLQQEAGTLVVWTSLDRIVSGSTSTESALGTQMDLVRQHLSLVFHRYLSGELGLKRVRVLLNEMSIEPQDPFLIGRSEQVMDVEAIVVEGHKITAVPFLLPHVSRLSAAELRSLGGDAGLRRQQGFYVYRNKRLLVWGTWFRLTRQDEFSKLARVRVDIPNALDHLWSIDIRKSRAMPPDIVRQNLARVVSKITGSSKRTWTFRGRKEIDDSVAHMWERVKTRDGVRYSINRDYPILDQLSCRLHLPEKGLLEKALCILEETFPRNSLYSDMVNDEKLSQQDKNITRELESIIRLMVDGVGAHEVEQLLTTLEKTEPFVDNLDLVRAIRREVIGS